MGTLGATVYIINVSLFAPGTLWDLAVYIVNSKIFFPGKPFILSTVLAPGTFNFVYVINEVVYVVSDLALGTLATKRFR